MMSFVRILLIASVFCFTFLESKAQSQGEPSFMTSIYFGGGSFFLDWDQSEEFKAFVEAIPNVENYLITVHSHTDNIGGKEYNEWLSEMRSDSVVEELLTFEGIKKTAIEIKDFGLFNPVYDNSTFEGRRMNRRVDVIFWLAI